MASAGATRSPTAADRQRPPADRLLAFLEQAAARSCGGRVMVVSLPAPVTEPELALEICAPRGLERRLAFFWAPPGGTAVVGSGALARIDPRGEDRLAELGRAVPALFARLDAVAYPGWPALEPRLFGGLAFAPGAADGGPWRGFGDGCFSLPRIAYARRGSEASLLLAIEPQARPQDAGAAAAAELERLLPALEAAACAPKRRHPQASHPPLALPTNEPPASWCTRVEAIRRVIRDGRFQKIVAARRASYRLAEATPVETVLARLAEQMPTCTRFAFLREEGSFFGATPERLISKRGLRIRTEALAGSHEGGREEELLASVKDQMEHSLAVQHIVSALDPLCRELRWCDRPQIRELRNLLHLETPIDGELRRDLPILELIGRLHPTPAVGGVPTAEAVAWIEEREVEPRGWYAGPVGWLDAAGNGDFAVALRSAVLGERQAHLWAGSGIVEDSDPERELAETELKLRAVLGALGGEGRGRRQPARAMVIEQDELSSPG